MTCGKYFPSGAEIVVSSNGVDEIYGSLNTDDLTDADIGVKIFYKITAEYNNNACQPASRSLIPGGSFEV